MIVDTSALVAIFTQEPGHTSLAEQPLLCHGDDFAKTDLAVVPG